MTRTEKRLSLYQQMILAECFRRATAQAESPEPPTWQRRDHADWLDARDFGPRYSCAAWFGDVSRGERMRFYRAFRALEEIELIEATRLTAARCRDVVHAKLTAAGETLARELTESTENV